MIFSIFKRPGQASAFNPIEGKAHECNTSEEEINTRILAPYGSSTC